MLCAHRRYPVRFARVCAPLLRVFRVVFLILTAVGYGNKSVAQIRPQVFQGGGSRRLNLVRGAELRHKWLGKPNDGGSWSQCAVNLD